MIESYDPNDQSGVWFEWYSGIDQFFIPVFLPEGSPPPIQTKKNLHPPSSKGIF